jgi:HEAT repeat protein
VSWLSSWSTGSSLASEVEGIRAGREILRRIHPCRLARFDAALHGRSWTSPSWFPGFWNVGPRHVVTLARLTGDAEATSVILAAHPSGWVRQAALRMLEECCTPLALGMLVLRSNDWVDAIRVEAQARLQAVASGDDSQRLVSILPAVEELARTDSRAGDFARAFLKHLADRLTTTTLMRGLSDADQRVRRSAARLLASRRLPDGALDVALEQDDTVTACIVAEAAVRTDPSQAIAQRLMAARSVRLRRLGMARLIELGGDPAEDAARAALLDSHPLVRRQAQGHLLRSGVALSGIYAGSLDSHPAAAILGLAETGSAKDAGRVVPYASHPSARVRDAVCFALARLDAQAHRHTLLALARDPSARVAAHAAAAIVGSHASAAELDQLWSLVATRPARRAVLAAFESLNRWLQLTYAFRAIASDIARNEGRLLLDRALSRWNDAFTAPSAERRRELASLLPTVLERLEPKAAHELEMTVGAFLDPGASIR